MIKDLVKELMRAKKTEVGGLKSPVSPEDLLIVAPYNHQVRNLQESLGKNFNFLLTSVIKRNMLILSYL